MTLVVRGDSLDAGMSQYLVGQVEATPKLDVRLSTEIVGGGGNGRLDYLVLRNRATAARSSVRTRCSS